MAKTLKKTVTVAYTYKIEADTQEGIDYVISELRSSPAFRFCGAGEEGCFRAELKKGKGKIIEL